jgi:lysophospholipase L1-like esterase
MSVGDKCVVNKPLVVSDSSSERISVVLLDSKAAYLEQYREEEKLYRGYRAEDLVDFILIQKLPEIVSQHKKPPLVYIWIGTCDITKKSHHHMRIDIRYFGNKTPNQVVQQLERARDFVLSIAGHIQFICLPPQSVVEYNRSKQISEPDHADGSDTEVQRQINVINHSLVSLNTSLERNTLKFDLDLYRTRRGRTNQINWKLLSDGVHPGEHLARKWLRRLELDIINDCYPCDSFQIEVDPQDIWMFPEN